MLHEVALHIAHMHLCNTSNIIFIDNGGVLMTPLPHDIWMWLIIRRSQKHSCVASYSAIISEWLVDMATKVCFTDRHDMVAPPQRNTKQVCDLGLWGSDI
jgi:hypothetical protein